MALQLSSFAYQPDTFASAAALAVTCATMWILYTGVDPLGRCHPPITCSTNTPTSVWQGSSGNSGPQQVADPLWERLKALVRTVLAALQPPLQQHAGWGPATCAPLSGCVCRRRALALCSSKVGSSLFDLI